MKYINYLFILIVILLNCSSQSIIEPPKENSISFEFDQWGNGIGSRNRATTYSEWQNKSGMHIAYAVINRSDQPIILEFKLFIYSARLWSNLNYLIPLDEAVLIATDIGLLAMDITANLDPIEIVDSFILEPDSAGYLIGFAEPIDWDIVWSVYSTVSIKATGVLSKVTYTQLISIEEVEITGR